MKTRRIARSMVGMVVLLLLCATVRQAKADTVIIDFDGATPGDYSTYSEDGFTLTPKADNEVRISNSFPPGSNAAQPSFGFGNGDHDDSFTFTNVNNLPFDAVSIDLLEANDIPDTFGVTVIGTTANLSTVTQTFTLDGIAGTQTFAFSTAFTGLVSLKIAEDSSNAFLKEPVQIDNVVLAFLPPDADGDGVPDDVDECPNSDLSATVVIDGCNSGVANTLFPSGCAISDVVAACAEGASNKGQFARCVSHATNDLKKAGTITGQQKNAIQSCAEQADIP
jgi:hypothetical protein